MDGLVLVLAVILNPRAARGAQREEPRSRDSARAGPGDGGATIATIATSASVVPAPTAQNEKNRLEGSPT
jgi:hypothetical protein